MTANSQAPTVKNVVLVGAGHAHVQVLQRFGKKPVPGMRLTLITRDVFTPYSGMLPGLIAGFYRFDEAHIDTAPLCRFARARLYLGAAIGIDQAAKTVICDNRPPVPYDILSIDTGSTPNTASVSGAAQHAIPVKPISGFLAHFEAMRRRVLAAGGAKTIIVVGAGAGGVELILSLERRLRRELSQAGHDPARLAFTLIAAKAPILPDFPDRFSRRFEAIMKARNIEVLTAGPVTGVESGAVEVAGLGRRTADEVFWVVQARPPEWLGSTGLALDGHGFIRVDDYLRAEGTDDIFGAGDVVAFGPRPLPKSGVYAVRQGPVLAENIRRQLTGRKLKPFRPQQRAMYLVSTGERYAIGVRGSLVFGGAWVWHWKDWIDRRFMARFAFS
jgi:selenide,water dikinase